MPIRFICDQDGCSNEQDTLDPKLPPGWSCDPIYKGGKYTRQMAYVCPECMEKRGRRRDEAKRVEHEQRSNQARVRRRKAEVEGQGSMF